LARFLIWSFGGLGKNHLIIISPILNPTTRLPKYFKKDTCTLSENEILLPLWKKICVTREYEAPSVGSKPQSYKLQDGVTSKYSEYTPEERVKVV